jgi:hypothetical protein
MTGRLLAVGEHGGWAGDVPRGWLRLSIIGGVIVLSALCAYLVPRAAGGSLSLLLGAGGVVLCLRWPPLGLVALIVGGLFAPFAVGTGTRTDVNLAILLVAVLLGLWIVEMLARRQVRLVPSPTIRPLLAFVVIAIVAFLAGRELRFYFAQTAPQAAQVGGLAIFLLSAGAFLLVAHQVREIGWLRVLTWVFLTSGGLYVAGWILAGSAPLTLLSLQSGAGGSLFWTWLVALASGQALFNRRLSSCWRLGLAGLVLGALYIGLFPLRSWSSGWVPPVVALLVILWSGAPRAALPVTLLGAALAAFNLESVLDFVMAGDNRGGMAIRLEFFHVMKERISASPWLGFGPANYFWYTVLFPTSASSYYPRFSSHNNYLDIVAQTGVLGLACFIWFAWEVGRLAWRLRTSAPAGFARAYAYSALGGLAGTLAAMLLGDWFLPFVYNVGLPGFRASVLGWLFLGGLVSIEQASRRD